MDITYGGEKSLFLLFLLLLFLFFLLLLLTLLLFLFLKITYKVSTSGGTERHVLTKRSC